MPFQLTSAQNPRIKALVRLNKRRERETKRLTLVEGTREIDRALACGVIPVDAFVCPSLVDDDAGRTVMARLRELDTVRRTRLYEVTPDIFARIAYRAESGGMVVTIPYLETSLTHLPPEPNPFYVILEGVEKPGNLGAILRSADAAGVHGLIVTQTAQRPATDLHNPNVTRASLGTLFSVPIAEASTQEAIEWLRSRGIRIIAATPDGAERYTDVNMTGGVAVALGSEAEGIGPELREAAEASVYIPMAGIADSLNLSTSAAVLFYEAVRQRRAGRCLEP